MNHLQCKVYLLCLGAIYTSIHELYCREFAGFGEVVVQHNLHVISDLMLQNAKMVCVIKWSSCWAKWHSHFISDTCTCNISNLHVSHVGT